MLGGQSLLAQQELPERPGVWKMTLEGQERWQSGHVLGQGTQGVQVGAAGTLAEGAQPWSGWQAHCLLRERDHWLPFFPFSSVQLGLALKWRTTVLHEQGH